MKKKNKKGLITALSLIALLLVLIAALIIWQWENIRALYIFATNDSAGISQTLEDKRNEQQCALEDEYDVTVQAPSVDQSTGLIDGTVTPEDVKDQLGITTPEDEPALPADEPDNKPQTSQSPQMTEEERKQKVNDLINRCVSELYECEIDLMARLGVMKKAAVEEWLALQPHERTENKKMDIGTKGLYACYDLEVETDTKVRAILEKYRPSLKELGDDCKVLDELWKYYCDKKASEKAYYMDKYL